MVDDMVDNKNIHNNNDHDFPWSLGVFDAHCHPTDTMPSIPDISSMNARILTVMATRAQDQDLVARVADDIGLTESNKHNVDAADYHGILPCFGWHPWFSHQVYDAEHPDYHLRRHGQFESASQSDDHTALSDDNKVRHYQSVLDPPSQDRAFLLSLPDPRSLQNLIEDLSLRLQRYPLALVGEVGLDKAFRIPQAWLPEQTDTRNDSLTPGGREGRRLSPYRVSLAHQKKILLAQLRLAGRAKRAVSVHGVQAHGHLYETLRETWRGQEKNPVGRRALKKQQKESRRRLHPDEEEGDVQITVDGDSLEGDSSGRVTEYPPRICLHSYSGPPDTLKQYLHLSVPSKIFFSFSMVISFSGAASNKAEAVINALPDDRILVESDLHHAGERMDQCLKDAILRICEVKGWDLERGIGQLGKNWKEFVFGTVDVK